MLALRIIHLALLFGTDVGLDGERQDVLIFIASVLVAVAGVLTPAVAPALLATVVIIVGLSGVHHWYATIIGPLLLLTFATVSFFSLVWW